MRKDPQEELSKFIQIENVQEKIEQVCQKFEKMEISAKAVRTFFDSLNVYQKMQLLDRLYKGEFAPKNMQRVPPTILIPKNIKLDDVEDIALYGKIFKYELLKRYDSSKTTQLNYKLRNTINQFLGSWEFNIDDCSEKFMENSETMHIDYLKIRAKQEIRNTAIREFVEELVARSGTGDTKPLNLPSAMTIGVELETIGLSPDEISEIRGFLKLFDIDYLKGFSVKFDMTVRELDKNGKAKKIGAEIESPILNDTEDSWTKLLNACAFLRAIGCKVNKTCGGHIHIGANIMGVDEMAWKTLLNVWGKAEPMIYAMSNRRGEMTRKGAIRDYATKIEKAISSVDWSRIKIKRERDLLELSLIMFGMDNFARYKAINLSNLSNAYKNTIEFRLSNGTIDYNIIRENILLYARLIQMVKIHSIDPTRKKKQLEDFNEAFEYGAPEIARIDQFLELVFDNEEERQIYYKRWLSKFDKRFLDGEYHSSSRAQGPQYLEAEMFGFSLGEIGEH